MTADPERNTDDPRNTSVPAEWLTVVPDISAP